MLHNPNNLHFVGKPIDEANRVMVMVHGRGSSARNILLLAEYIQADDFAFVAPEATGGTWYPHSFLSPVAENEPYLSSAFTVLAGLRAWLQSDYNVKFPQIYWLGFSQGACLLLEFLARHPAEYGGIFGLSGGLIGSADTSRNYQGTFDKTPVFLGCSDVDTHVPKERVLETEAVYQQLGADVMTKLYPNFLHTINDDELKRVNLLIAGAS